MQVGYLKKLSISLAWFGGVCPSTDAKDKRGKAVAGEEIHVMRVTAGAHK